MAKTAKPAAPALEKKSKVKKTIEKPKPAQKATAKKVVKAAKTENKKPAAIAISGKYNGIKEKKPKAAAPAKNAQTKTAGNAKTPIGQKKKAAVKNSGNTKAVVKINSLPHGFYEEQLKGYFAQFGEVTNTKVVRSQKTGRSKGVAFVEFSIPEVAEIAAETMNNYLLFKNLLKTEYIPPNKVKPGLFTKVVEVVIKPDGTQHIISAVTSKRKAEVKKLNAKPTTESAKKRRDRLENKLRLKNKFLKKLGVNLKIESLVQGSEALNLGGGDDKKKPKSAVPKAAKPEQNVTVKVSNEEAKPVEKKAVEKKQKQKPEAKKEAPVAVAPVTQQQKGKKAPVVEEKKAKETPAGKKNAGKEQKKPQEKQTPAPTAAAKKAPQKGKKATPAEPKPTAAVVPAKNVKKAPAAKQEKPKAEPKAAPAKKAPAAAKGKKEAAPVKAAAAPAAKKGAKGGAVAEKKAPAVKKTIEKKKQPLKLTPKKKSAK